MKSNIYGMYSDPKEAALQTILEIGAGSLPISLNAVCSAYNISIIPSDKAPEQFSLPKNEKAMVWQIRDWRIVYDVNLPIENRRLAIAHEIGHVLLGHNIYGDTLVKDPEQEAAADQFALDLLAPGVVWKSMLGYKSMNVIAEVCNILKDAAKLQLKHNVGEYESGKAYKPLSPLENDIICKFHPWAENVIAYEEAGKAPPWEKEKTDNL